MAKTFGGFTDQQKEVLARKLGFNGPMDQFGKFLQTSPAHQQKFLSYEEKARKMVEGTGAANPKPTPAFSTGGTVTTTTTGATNAVNMAINSPGNTLTNQAIQDPTSLVTPTQVTQMQVSQDELVNQNAGQVTRSPDVVASQVAPAAQAAQEAATPAPTVQTATSNQQVVDATQNMQAAQGTVSSQAQVTAATALPSANATVQGQLEGLMKQFEGGETPPWAAGALRNAQALMAQRGMGSSSIAASAATQAAMESAIQIAAQDAATFSQFEMQNLNNRQQARLVNAQSFLQMDLANLDAAQQTEILKSQSIIQSLFTDQAAENASRQFNATSQAQTDQFFANLRTQVSQFNAAQTNAMEQFRAGQADSVAMFNRQMNDATEQFNASNRLIIDQSNAEWRRAVTTANNAAINEANRLDAQAATGMTLAGYNNLMQRERDLYSFVFTASENAAGRAHELALAQYNARAGRAAATGQAVGMLGATLIQGLFGGFG